MDAEWSDPDRREAALERVLLRTEGYATINRGKGQRRAYLVRLVEAPFRAEPTPGELRVIEAISHGLTTEQAAELLGVSAHTVKSQLKRAAPRMAAKNTLHLVALCLRRGLIS